MQLFGLIVVFVSISSTASMVPTKATLKAYTEATSTLGMSNYLNNPTPRTRRMSPPKLKPRSEAPVPNPPADKNQLDKDRLQMRRSCVNSCRRFFARADANLHFCVEGCRIKVNRRIYECVYEMCNDKGFGVHPETSRREYGECVKKCKDQPKKKQTKVKPTNGPANVVHEPSNAHGPGHGQQTTTDLPRISTGRSAGVEFQFDDDEGVNFLPASRSWYTI